VPRGTGWRWNQAMLDLGATVCRARRPDCDGCPVRSGCASAGGVEAADPARGSAHVSGRQSRFDGSDRQGEYLASELSAHSGFRRVTRDGRDPASAFLAVDLSVSIDDSLLELLSDDDDSEITYSAAVHYQLFAADGHLIDSGLLYATA